MSPITVIDDQHARMVYYPDKKIIHHRLSKSIDSKHLRDVLNCGVSLLKEYKGGKWLSDNRDINPHSPEDGEWVNSDWLPRAVAEGWKYWALVVPNDIMARMNMKEFVDSFYEKGVRIMVFSEIDNAMSWLENVDHQ